MIAACGSNSDDDDEVDKTTFMAFGDSDIEEEDDASEVTVKGTKKHWFTWTLFLAYKEDTFDVFEIFIKKMEKKLGTSLVFIRSEHGTKFENAKFLDFCSSQGIDHNFSAPRTPQQNGVVERKNRTLEDMARTTMLAANIAKNLWAEAMSTATYIINRSRLRSMCAFKAFLSEIEPKKVTEALLDVDWIFAMQDELNQFERSKVYVDDIIFGSTNILMTHEFAKLMSCEFKISMMGELNFFLGLQIKKSALGTMIHQQKYVKELLKRCSMEEAKDISTPIATATKQDLDETGSDVDQKMYRGMIGSLLYLTESSPDIMFSVGLCARFQAKPKESHLKSVKRIFRYLKGTSDISLWISGGQEKQYWNGSLSWIMFDYLVTKKQNSIGLSIAEAEYVASVKKPTTFRAKASISSVKTSSTPPSKAFSTSKPSSTVIDFLSRVSPRSSTRLKKQVSKPVPSDSSDSDFNMDTNAEIDPDFEDGLISFYRETFREFARPEVYEFYKNGVGIGELFSTTIRKVTLNLYIADNARILHFPSRGWSHYVKESWPPLDNLASALDICRKFSGKPTLVRHRRVFKREMSPLHQLYFDFVHKMILPRKERRTISIFLDLTLIELLDTKVRIDLPRLILKHMQRVLLKEVSGHALPYQFWLTSIFEDFGISVQVWTSQTIKDIIGHVNHMMLPVSMRSADNLMCYVILIGLSSVIPLLSAERENYRPREGRWMHNWLTSTAYSKLEQTGSPEFIAWLSERIKEFYRWPGDIVVGSGSSAGIGELLMYRKHGMDSKDSDLNSSSTQSE
ncbi:hypothetical protein FXO37_16246 [Capsicum annuum]|nr:hypothetical protein FXO37_16246 [Capsicum annuum]